MMSSSTGRRTATSTPFFSMSVRAMSIKPACAIPQACVCSSSCRSDRSVTSRSPRPSAATDRCLGPACTPCRRESRTPSPPTRSATSRGDAAAYDGPAGRARDQRSVADGSRAHPCLGHLDFADFHLRDAGAERDPRGLDLLPEGLRLRLQVGGVLVGPDPNELVLRPIDPGRHDRPADLVMERLGLLFEVLDEGIQLALVDRVNADLCLHLLCFHSRRGVCSIGILSGKKMHTCLLTAMDIPPPLDPCAAYPSPLHDRESRAKKIRCHRMEW